MIFLCCFGIWRWLLDIFWFFGALVSDFWIVDVLIPPWIPAIDSYLFSFFKILRVSTSATWRRKERRHRALARRQWFLHKTGKISLTAASLIRVRRTISKHHSRDAAYLNSISSEIFRKWHQKMHIHGYVHVDGSTRKRLLNVPYAGATGPRVQSTMLPRNSLMLQAAGNGETRGTIGISGTAGTKIGKTRKVLDGLPPNHQEDFRAIKIFKTIIHREAVRPKAKGNGKAREKAKPNRSNRQALLDQAKVVLLLCPPGLCGTIRKLQHRRFKRLKPARTVLCKRWLFTFVMLTRTQSRRQMCRHFWTKPTRNTVETTSSLCKLPRRA